MAKVEALKCPNCGAAVAGTGQVVCIYCGSPLSVSDADKARLTQLKTHFGTPGRAVDKPQAAHFTRLPDQVITPQTREIPFRPEVSYEKLRGGKLDPNYAGDAQAIVDVCRAVHEATNREDLESYATTLDPAAAGFAAKARKAATTQFTSNDMKRYTARVAFTKLSHERAGADVTIEALIFFPAGFVNHLEVTFGYKFRKTPQGWRVYGSAVKRSPGLACGSSLALIGPAVGLIIGIIAAIVAVTKSCQDHAAREERAATITQPATPPPPQPPSSNPDARGYYAAKTGIPLYATPDISGRLTGVVLPESKFKVTAKTGDWYRIQQENGAVGWVPKEILVQSTGGDPEVR
jgi:hypothetical protein